MSLTPLQVQIVVDTGRFDEAIRKAIQATQKFGRTWGWRPIYLRHQREKRHQVRVQYRRKSRGHR